MSTIDKPANAQEAFTLLLSNWISQGLRRLDFRGSGNRFSLRCDVCWISLGFQKSKFSSKAQVKFTINLQVTNKAAWERARSLSGGLTAFSPSLPMPSLPPRPSPGTVYVMHTDTDMPFAPSVNIRIGHLLPEGTRDHWWTVEPETNLEHLASEVLSTVERFGVPWPWQEMRTQGCITHNSWELGRGS